MTFDWWTLGLQAVNVAILVWLLQRFFWRPVAAAIAGRRQQVQALLGEAAEKRARAEAALAEAAAARKGFAAEREAILAAARDAAEAEKQAITKAARDEAEALRAAARRAIREEAEKAAAEAAAALGLDIARRLAARLKGPAVEAAFVDWLCEAIRGLPDADRQALLREGAALELVAASDVDRQGRARIAAALGAALGGRPRLRFRTDPALIAGFELHGPHIVLRNSWQADLERIAAGVGAGAKNRGADDVP